MVNYENEVCEFLRIPSIPKKAWNGKDAFKRGVAVLCPVHGDDCYGVVTFDPSVDEKPRVIKVFGVESFTDIKDVKIVPSYMESPKAEETDLDDESKKRLAELEKEAAAVENEGVNEEKVDMPENEYFFDNIHNDEEGRAFIEAWNKSNHIKGSAPKKHETIVMRLGVIWAEQNKK